ncbi:hypothetical protein [Halococcus saccharolyticus]|uniref:Cell surface glycoprotein n=1 Tax=Halococcus saccharolyticus DSM 5350 TaxID=1227455 RepID=M0ME11_9EURY|nr:hypothetical protein [Halococcus saccharolyticus]EMA42645.1 hypothetical protein C449_15923 [Halococcus saccharolyticus DSM 5350]
MDRRKYLSAAALATVGLAGCSGDSGGNNSSNGSGGGSNATEAATDTQAATATEAETEMTTTAGNVETQAATEAETAAGEETTMASNETEAMTTSGDEPTTGGPQTTGSATNGSANATGNASASSSGGFSETFSGSGTSTIEDLQLSPGPVTAEFSVGSEGYYSVTLVTLEGESYQDVFLVDGIISGEGSQVKTAAVGGGYNLNVEIEGDWELTIEQPTDLQPESLPIDASGDGMSYLGPFQFDGPTTFQGSHGGDANFIVTGIPTDPSGVQASIFNKMENFEGETTARVSGTKYINVVANGEWSLSSG